MNLSTRFLSIALLLASGAAIAQPLRTQATPGASAPEATRPISDAQVLSDPDNDPLSWFGTTTALSGNRALASAVRNDLVFAYERIDGVWTLTQEIQAPPLAVTFGSSLAMDGDRAVIGSTQDLAGAGGGAAYVYEVQSGVWTLTAELRASDAKEADSFGRVAIEGDRIAVGAAGVDGRNGQRVAEGAAYIFELSAGSWSEVAKLKASDPSKDAFFGSNLVLWGDRLLVSASGDKPQTNSLGSVYGFRFDGSTWLQEVKWTADAGHQGHFGRPQGLAMDDGRALIGLTTYVQPGVFARSVYTYDVSGSAWTRTGTLDLQETASIPNGIPQLAIDGTDALISSLQSADEPKGAVAIYEYASEWAETDRFAIEDDGETHRLAYLSLSDGTAWVTDNNLIQDPDKYVGQIYAFDLREASPQITLEIESYNSTPERGESVFFRGPSTNNGSETVRAYYWFTYTTPDGRTRRTNLGGLNLAPGQTINFRQFRKNRVVLPADALEGDYTVTVFVSEGGRTGPVLASDQFVLKLGPLAAAPEAAPAKTAAPTAGPNPFRDRTTISYTLAEDAEVDLRIVDALGREVATLVNAVQASGAHTATFQPTGLPAGVYTWRLSVSGEVSTGRMTLAR